MHWLRSTKIARSTTGRNDCAGAANIFAAAGGRAAEARLIPALAVLREAADRQLGLRPFNVQLMGALALHRGLLSEMATGEGKTLTAGLVGVLAGWTGHPTHIVTVNDYLGYLGKSGQLTTTPTELRPGGSGKPQPR